MSTTVCLVANTATYPEGGGHFWVYLNWALGFRALGCDVIWMEGVWPGAATEKLGADCKTRLAPYGFGDRLALFSWNGEPLMQETRDASLSLEASAHADLLLNLAYDIPAAVVKRFKRSALLDIDPGLLQVWVAKGRMSLPPHHTYFTIGETVGQPDARFPDVGLPWQYTPPCVALEWWPPHRVAGDAPFTTVSHWHGDEWEIEGGEVYSNNKRDGFLPFLDLPTSSSVPLELALNLAKDDEDERAALTERGWRLRDAFDVASTPWDYQRYIQSSLGEFSCVKPSCLRFQNAWISDRTLCYLASGKPAVVQYTGPSRFLPESGGLFRFRDVGEALRGLETVAADYDGQCKLARELAEEYFDARKVAGQLLERAL